MEANKLTRTFVLKIVVENIAGNIERWALFEMEVLSIAIVIGARKSSALVTMVAKAFA